MQQSASQRHRMQSPQRQQARCRSAHLNLGRYAPGERYREGVVERRHVGASGVQRCDVREGQALAVQLRVREGAREASAKRGTDEG